MTFPPFRWAGLALSCPSTGRSVEQWSVTRCVGASWRRKGGRSPHAISPLLIHQLICTVVQMSGSASGLRAVTSIEACEVRVVDPAKVAATRDRLPSTRETDALADWFKVLGDATRARILYAVLEAGDLCVCDLAATVDVPESTVSHALRWLRGAGVVRARRDGKMMYYSLDDEHVRMLLEIGREHLRHRDRVR